MYGVTFDMFMADYHRWREMSGQVKWDWETIDRVFGDMSRTYICVEGETPEQKVIMNNAYEAAVVEHGYRQAHRMFSELQARP